jgi:hypothetical protein
MTASSSDRADHRTLCLLIGHGAARSDCHSAAQIVRPIIICGALHRSSTGRLPVAMLAQSRRSNSCIAPAAIKSP